MSAEPSTDAEQPIGLDALLENYHSYAGVADELKDAGGEIRPVWRSFLEELARRTPGELAHAQARGTQYLRDAGVFFRHYGPEAQEEREWPLSHLPLLLDAGEWQGIADGLTERAELLERIMADLYGPADLISEGVLPPGLVAASPEWLRPMVGVRPRDGHYLHMLAFDIGRGPDGMWWVLGDRAQAPSGAGFALETRMATSRSFPEHLARTNTMRLAGFFRAFRDALLDLRAEDDSRVAILTPGPLTDTYYEHAYIARYLGFLLVQGEDLVVRGGRLMVQTVGGLRPVSVLWRRLDSGWLDPLELREDSRIGTPGLLAAMRAQGLTMVNAPGSGVLETRAFMAFIPAIARKLLGRDLAMPNIATWWCGSAEARDYVRANAERMTIDRALSTRLPFDHSPDAIIAGKTLEGEPFDSTLIEKGGAGLAAQEIVSLSTAPALNGPRLEARPMSLRVIVARTQDGWQAMPGGFARIGLSARSADISVQRGGAVADVWVISDAPLAGDTLLPREGARAASPQLTSLPTRAADNFFWLGRYSERVEHKLRLLRAYHLRLAEHGLTDLPVMVYLANVLDGMGVDTEERLPEGLMADVNAALGSAGSIRDRFSTDGWNALTDLHKSVSRIAPRLERGDDAARALSVFLRKISGFSGLVHENMYHGASWRFLSLGRNIERAWAMANMLMAFTDPDGPEGILDIAIETGDAIMTHRQGYPGRTTRTTVLDLLLLDPAYPRSVVRQVMEALHHIDWLDELPGGARPGHISPIRKALMELRTSLAVSVPQEIDPEKLAEIARAAAALSGCLAESYLR